MDHRMERKKTTSGKRKKRSRAGRYVARFFGSLIKWLLLLGLLCCVIGGVAGVVVVKKVIAEAPAIDMNSIVPQGYATTIYDSTGKVTTTLVMEGSNREWATYQELPKNLVNAFVSYEDARFWKHNGIDIKSILRAAKGVITHDPAAGGGSTITQQLIKNNVFRGGMEKTFAEKLKRKIQEQYLALQVEKKMSKEMIITNYLNTINLGNNTLGVKVAAKRYFNKNVSDLTLSECAVLAGISQNPTKFNPVSGQAENAKKRKVILQDMADQGYITKAQQQEALADDVYARIQSVDMTYKDGAAPYSYFTDEVIDQAKAALMESLGYTDDQAHDLLYSGGLSIYTTQDPEIQAIVDQEINDPKNYNLVKYSLDYRLSVTHSDGTTTHYSDEDIKRWHKEVLKDKFNGLYDSEESLQADVDAYKKYLLKPDDKVIGERVNKILQPQASFVLMDQKTGEVRAISGGRGSKTASRTLNRATNTLRQPGSAFKVITSFAPALDARGATLGTVYYDTSYTVGNKTFSNWYKSQGFLGYHNIREGIAYSMNILAVRCLMETVTPELGLEYAKKFGITTLKDTDKTAALALGGITDGVSNLELTGAYATIADGGVYHKPIFFTRILDHSGKVIYENQPQPVQVLKDSTAFLLTDAMADSMKPKQIYARPGIRVSTTSTKAALKGMSAAGKSGTTTSDKDLWFVGFTPYYTAGIWSGYDSNQEIKGGTSYHKVIWQKIMTRVHQGKKDPGFPVPSSVVTAQICRKSGKLPIPGVCDQDPRGNAVYTEYFAKGTVPTETCDHHVVENICNESGLLATPYCPSVGTRVFMVVPPNSGVTDDSLFAVPGYCNIHGEGGVTLPTGQDGQSVPPPSGTGGAGSPGLGGPGFNGPGNLEGSGGPGGQEDPVQPSKAPTETQPSKPPTQVLPSLPAQVAPPLETTSSAPGGGLQEGQPYPYQPEATVPPLPGN